MTYMENHYATLNESVKDDNNLKLLATIDFTSVCNIDVKNILSSVCDDDIEMLGSSISIVMLTEAITSHSLTAYLVNVNTRIESEYDNMLFSNTIDVRNGDLQLGSKFRILTVEVYNKCLQILNKYNLHNSYGMKLMPLQYTRGNDTQQYITIGVYEEYGDANTGHKSN